MVVHRAYDIMCNELKKIKICRAHLYDNVRKEDYSSSDTLFLSGQIDLRLHFLTRIPLKNVT